jgi:hypothetical protein
LHCAKEKTKNKKTKKQIGAEMENLGELGGF